MIADGVFMLVVYAGLVRFLDIEIVQVFLWLFGGFILFYTGIEGVLKSNSIKLSRNRQRESLMKSFLQDLLCRLPVRCLFYSGWGYTDRSLQKRLRSMAQPNCTYIAA